MKALSLWQPWATLVALGEKKVETRCWDTKYRGLLAIHSTQTIPRWLGESRKSQQFHDLMMQCLAKHNVQELVKGSVLCIVELKDVITVDTVRNDLSPQEILFGNYEDGRYAWFFELVEKFDKPIPAKGNRMLWNWSGR